MLAPVRTEAPSIDLLTRDEVKTHLRIDDTAEDVYIDGLIASVTAFLDGWRGRTGRCLLHQTWRQDFRRFPADGCLRLPMAPVTSIIQIEFSDGADVDQVFDAANYVLAEDALGYFVSLKSGSVWPATDDRIDAVRVTFTAGYAAQDDPDLQGLRHAAMLIIGEWYENREEGGADKDMKDLSFGVRALLAPYQFRSYRPSR